VQMLGNTLPGRLSVSSVNSLPAKALFIVS
jgi:hypothetical protein